MCFGYGYTTELGSNEHRQVYSMSSLCSCFVRVLSKIDMKQSVKQTSAQSIFPLSLHAVTLRMAGKHGETTVMSD